MMNIFNKTEEERSQKARSLFDRAMSYYHNGIYVYPVYQDPVFGMNTIYKRSKMPQFGKKYGRGKHRMKMILENSNGKMRLMFMLLQEKMESESYQYKPKAIGL